MSVLMEWLDSQGEILVSRDGAALRTSDDLNVTFIADVVGILESVPDAPDVFALVRSHLRMRSGYVEEWQAETVADVAQHYRDLLQELDYALQDPMNTGCRWFADEDDDSRAFADEAREDLESILFGLGLHVWREDGYVISAEPIEESDY